MYSSKVMLSAWIGTDGTPSKDLPWANAVRINVASAKHREYEWTPSITAISSCSVRKAWDVNINHLIYRPLTEKKGRQELTWKRRN